MEIPEVEYRGTDGEIFLEEIMAGNFPKMERHMDFQVHEAQNALKKFNIKMTSPRHIIKSKNQVKRILKLVREMRLIKYKGTPLRL